jgi:pterin-4a-carbinolamine dehydratase
MNEQSNVQELKSERVQEPEALQNQRAQRPNHTAGPRGSRTRRKAQQRLKSERVQLRLRQMPGWRMQKGSKTVDRMRRFPDPLTAATYLGFAAVLAGQAGQPLCASVIGGTVVLALPGRFKNGFEGVTEEVLNLAEQLG